MNISDKAYEQQPASGHASSSYAGHITIGDKQFRVKTGGGKAIDNEVLIGKLQKIINKSDIKVPLDEFLNKHSVSTSTKSLPLKIVMSSERVIVGRGEVSEVLPTKVHGKSEIDEQVDIDTDYAKRMGKFSELVSMQKQIGERLKDFSPAAQKKAIESLLGAGRMALRDLQRGEGFEGTKGEKTIIDPLYEPGNEMLRIALFATRHAVEKTVEDGNRKVSKNEIKACRNQLKFFILNNLVRSPQVLQTEGGNYLQRFNRGQGILKDPLVLTSKNMEQYFVADKGWSSEADKSSKCEFKDQCTNLGAIHVRSQNGPEEVSMCVVTRSGRSNSPERLKECVLNACLQQLQSTEPKGFEYKNGVCEFQHVITTYLDQSVFKGQEPKYLNEILKAQDTWPGDGIKVIVEGKEITLKKPIVMNQPFSAVLKGVSVKGHELIDLGVEEAFHAGFIGNQQLARRVITTPSAAMKSASDALNTLLHKCIKPTPEGGFMGPDGMVDFAKVSAYNLMNPRFTKANFYKSKEFQDYQKAVSVEIGRLYNEEMDAGKKIF